MKPNRIVLALAFASLAAPAFAEKCHYCDFSDEPIVVTPKKNADTTPAAASRTPPAGWQSLEGWPSKSTPSSPKEILVGGPKIEPKGSLPTSQPMKGGTMPHSGLPAPTGRR